MSNTLDNRKARLSPTHHPRRTHRLAQVSRCVSSLFSGPYLYFTWCQRHRFPLEQNPMTGIINDSANLTCFSGSVQFSSVAQSCPALCNPMNCCTPGLPVHHQLPEFTQTHVHQVEHVKLIESILLTVHPLLHGPFSLQLQKPVIPILSLVRPSQSSGQGTLACGQGAALENSLLGLISADESWSCHGGQAYSLCCLKIFGSLTCSYLFSWLNCS